MNQSINFPQQFSFVKNEMTPVLSQTAPSFYPPAPKAMEQVTIKENKSPNRSTIVQGSPLKRIIVTRPGSPVKNQISNVVIQ